MKDKRVQNLSRRYLRRKAAEGDVETPKLEIIPPGRLIDLINFDLALDAYMTHMENKGVQADAVQARGLVLLRRFFPTLQSGIEQSIYPLEERNDAGVIRTPLHKAKRSGSALMVSRYQAEMFKVLMPWMKNKPGVLMGIFTGRSAQAARQVAILAQEESPAALLNKAATVPPVSGLISLRKWIESAAANAGAPVAPIESAVVDAVVAKNIGEDLQQIETQIEATPPNTPEAANLQEQRSNLYNTLQTTADSSVDKSTVIATAATALTTPRKQDIATRVGHTKDQKAAMVARGRAIIAAGAGSGKTRVLASKVVHHIEELGVAPEEILATSFSRKASKELIDRIKNYGGIIEGPALDGFGTTHYVAGQILKKATKATQHADYIGRESGWKSKWILRLAMEQAKMKIAVVPDAPEPRGIWDQIAGAVAAPATLPAPAAPSVGGDAGGYSKALADAADYFGWASRTWSGGARDWASRGLQFVNDMGRKSPENLSPKQKDYLNSLLAKVKKPLINYRVRSAADAAPGPKKRQNKEDKYYFAKNPANQWFNLGLSLTTERGSAVMPIPMGEFRNAISILKGRGISPSEAWAGKGMDNPHMDEAAVYGAYEWIKSAQGESEFANLGDMDDLLIDTVRSLIENPQLLRAVQDRFKVILVDEAQDLNRVQHLMFGLIAGYLDPKTLKPWPDKHMTADTFCLIGDDKQCVSVNTPVDVLHGTKKAGDLKAGDDVISYRNGSNTAQKVRHAVRSSWTWGYQITTDSGHALTMTPNHRLWATDPQTKEGQVAVYLMYRKDMGFRVGITNKGKVGSEDNYLNSYGGRCFLEKAERLWILDICESREEALLKEAQLSLRHSIPTTVFNGEHRGISQARIDALFKEFGESGSRLLEQRYLSFDHPHWMSQSYTKHGRERHTINLIAHSGSNTQVAMEWAGDKFDDLLRGMGVQKAPEDRRRLRRWFANYREGLDFAQKLASLTGANVSHRLSTPEGPVREVTASALFIGMKVPVRDGDGLVLEAITDIKKVDGEFVDLDVTDASNFFGGGILSHNSIYEFRGADPDEFIEKSDLYGEEGQKGDFTTKLLDINFRSGKQIVEAAGRLISHNQKQVPMACKAYEKKGEGLITSHPAEDVSSAAAYVGDDIKDIMEGDSAGKHKYSDFGIAVRSNAEAYSYGLELLKRGIPFKTNAQFFNDPAAKALIGWLSIAEKGLDGPKDIMEQALRDSTRAPFSKIGPKFFEKMEDNAEGVWTRWLAEGNWQAFYSTGTQWYETADHFVDNVIAVSKYTGTPPEIMNKLLMLKGIDGKALRDSLVDAVKDNDEMMNELVAEAEGGKVSEEQIIEQAMAPLAPLVGLLEGKNNLDDAMDFVRKLQKVNSKLATADDKDAEYDRDAVTIGTMHSWKGLESPTMYIPMIGSKFPRSGKDGFAPESPALWSERRLAYVAITRAQERCILLDIPHPKFGTHSQFLLEACVPEQTEAHLTTVEKTASEWSDDAIEELRSMEPDESLMVEWFSGEQD